MNRQVRILTGDPVVIPMAHMTLIPGALEALMNWVEEVRPECVPEEFRHVHKAVDPELRSRMALEALLPHSLFEDGRELTGNELLTEIAGRGCYQSWGQKAGRKSNREYIANTQSYDVPHRSIVYHPHMSYFIAGVSRRVSHELMRNYIGHAKDEEGSPSQESTRYVEHSGRFIAPPYILDKPEELQRFTDTMQRAYDGYISYIEREFSRIELEGGHKPDWSKTEMRKRVYESASAQLPHTAETSWLWTSNPIAMAKLDQERDHPAADLEYRRLARALKQVNLQMWRNCFPQPWMKL